MLTKTVPKFILFGIVFAKAVSVFAAVAAVLASGTVFVEQGFSWPFLRLAAYGGISVLLFVMARHLRSAVVRLFFTRGKRV